MVQRFFRLAGALDCYEDRWGYKISGPLASGVPHRNHAFGSGSGVLRTLNLQLPGRTSFCQPCVLLQRPCVLLPNLCMVYRQTIKRTNIFSYRALSESCDTWRRSSFWENLRGACRTLDCSPSTVESCPRLQSQSGRFLSGCALRLPRFRCFPEERRGVHVCAVAQPTTYSFVRRIRRDGRPKN
jgi:hypothetical protein